MIPFTDKEKKRFTAHLINARISYQYIPYSKLIPNYIDYILDCIDIYEKSKYHDNVLNGPLLKVCYKIIKEHQMTDEDINNFIATMDNPRKKWNERMKTHNNGGKETRDNKGQFVRNYVYQEPIRYANGNIYMCRRNIIRYPKKCRSLRTWRKFYEMFPKQAEIDGWDGKTSIRMK